MFYPYKIPKLLTWFFPGLEWAMPARDNKIYITFDDGPNPSVTPWVLAELKKYNAPATFFCVGENAENNQELMGQMIKSGHTIGNHTQNHIKGWKAQNSDYIKNIQMATPFIESKLFRPPYGRITRKQISLVKSEGYRIIMWSLLSCDYLKNLNRKQSLEALIKGTKPGSIVVFHDSEKCEDNLKWLLPRYLEVMSKKGFVFSAIK